MINTKHYHIYVLRIYYLLSIVLKTGSVIDSVLVNHLAIDRTTESHIQPHD